MLWRIWGALRERWEERKRMRVAKRVQRFWEKHQ